MSDEVFERLTSTVTEGCSNTSMDEPPLTLDGLSWLKEYITETVEPVQEELFDLRAQIDGPAGSFCRMPVIVSRCLGDFIYRKKRWRRRGREAKVKVKTVGRKPAFYQMGNTIVTNPEGLKLLKEAVNGRP